jgi:hypothetical protein
MARSDWYSTAHQLACSRPERQRCRPIPSRRARWQIQPVPSTGQIIANVSGNLQYGANDSGANQIFLYNGGAAALDATAADSTTHAAQGLFNNTSSTVYIDGTLTSPGSAIGTLGIPASALVLGAEQAGASCAGASAFLAGNVFEVGIWASDKTANNATMNSNQHTYWSF